MQYKWNDWLSKRKQIASVAYKIVLLFTDYSWTAETPLVA